MRDITILASDLTWRGGGQKIFINILLTAT